MRTATPAVIVATAAGLIFAAPVQTAAQNFLPKPRLGIAAAEKIADVCLDWYKAHPNPSVPTIWILDVDGNPILVKRVDGSAKIGVETAEMKARTALYVSGTSRSVQGFIRMPNGETNPVGQVQVNQLNTYPSPGGIAIKVDGKVIGAVGVGGMTPSNGMFPDEICAQTGIDAVFKTP